MRLISWNIDSLNAALTGTSTRAAETRAVLDKLRAAQPEALAIQETKLSAAGPTKQHLAALADRFPDYDLAWRSSVAPARKGYAGTMYLYKKTLTPQVTYPVIGAPAPMDAEGRIITLEFDQFYLTEVYTPNSGNGLKRLAAREEWDDAYRAYLVGLDQHKPVIASGDFNVAHAPIDLAHPANNHHSAGFTDAERAHFSQLLAAGFTDTFRALHTTETGAYSWWAQRAVTSKQNNSGWRIDYWLVSNRWADRVTASTMIDSGPRRDHTPIQLDLDL